MALMDYCPSCGEKINSDYNVCSKCGEKLEQDASKEQAGTTQSVFQGNTFIWGLLGFLVPIVGLFLFLVWKEGNAPAANAAGTGALVSVITWTLLVMFFATAAGASMTVVL